MISVLIIILRPAPAPYIPGEELEGLTKDLARKLPEDYPHWEFIDVARQSGIKFRHFNGLRSTQLPEDMGSGVAWGDYDNDGWLDLYLVNEAGPLTQSDDERRKSPAHNVLYHNSGDGTFEDVTAKAGVGHAGCGQAAAWADYDNDGYLDLVSTNYGEIVMYHNNRNGTFTDVSSKTGVAGFTGFWTGASWGDYNRDGLPDLYVCGYVNYQYDPQYSKLKTQQYDTVIPAALNPSTYKAERNLLFSNAGDGTFTETAKAAGVENATGRSLSATWCDFDMDGWSDLYVANDISDNVLYRNLGDGTFEDISHEAWVADYRGAMGLAVGDWDGDEDMDIFVTHWIAQENALYNNLHSEYARAGMNTGTAMNFSDIADQTGLGQIALDYIGWGTDLADFDNDGRLDLIISNGSTFENEEDTRFLAPMKLLLFWNKGPDAGFFDVSAVSGPVFKQHYVGRGLATADYDNDGDADIVVIVNGGEALLLKNQQESGNHWLKVRLRPQQGNKFGLGATIKLYHEDTVQMREVGAGSSYLSQHAVGEVLFGLGSDDHFDSLNVNWYGRKTQFVKGDQADQIITITDSIVQDK